MLQAITHLLQATNYAIFYVDFCFVLKQSE